MREQAKRERIIHTRTYYIHVKITLTALHVIATLCKTPPKGYEFARTQEAKTMLDALKQTAAISELTPTRTKVKTPGELQASFIHDEKGFEHDNK